MSLRIFINTSPSAVSDPQILKLIPNEHLVQIQHWMSQSNPERISHSENGKDQETIQSSNTPDQGYHMVK